MACSFEESLISLRPYRRTFDLAAAMSQLAAGSGTKYDPEVVACLTDLIERGEYLPDGR
ncbi:MAG: hypothetical protein JXA58_05065 [Dehalococcoidia bacterium]|nr:hypothetical protein [Dehalococcoidia bacterium]